MAVTVTKKGALIVFSDHYKATQTEQGAAGMDCTLFCHDMLSVIPYSNVPDLHLRGPGHRGGTCHRGHCL